MPEGRFHNTGPGNRGKCYVSHSPFTFSAHQYRDDDMMVGTPADKLTLKTEATAEEAARRDPGSLRAVGLLIPLQGHLPQDFFFKTEINF